MHRNYTVKKLNRTPVLASPTFSPKLPPQVTPARHMTIWSTSACSALAREPKNTQQWKSTFSIIQAINATQNEHVAPLKHTPNIKANISFYLQISRTLKMNPSFIQLDPNTRNPLGSPSRLGHVAPNVNSKFFWSNSPELPSPILVLSSQSPPAPQFSNQRPKTPITRKAQCSMTHYRLQFVPPHPHKNSPKVPSWATTRPKTIAARLKTDLSVRLSQFLRPPQSTPSPPKFESQLI